jgi:hypothetical protein
MIVPEPLSFEWDKGNSDKNRISHGISNEQAEEPFFDDEKKIAKDVFHSNKEKRYILLGKTKNYILLYIAWTIRNKKIRIISARRMNKKEVPLYEK